MVNIGFFTLPVLMACTPLLLFSKATDRSILTKKYLLILVVWCIYIAILSTSGVLATLDMPPRVPLLIVFPAILAIIFFTGRSLFQKNITEFSLPLTIYVQSFRIVVELLIWGAFLNDILPEGVTFEGANFDVLVGISALVVGLLYQKGLFSLKSVLYWNVASLLVLTSTLGAFIFHFFLAGSDVSTMVADFTSLPIILLPSMLVPFAVFYHVVSIRICLYRLKK